MLTVTEIALTLPRMGRDSTRKTRKNLIDDACQLLRDACCKALSGQGSYEGTVSVTVHIKRNELVTIEENMRRFRKSG